MPKKFFRPKNKSISPEGFRYRGLETTRLENLTDAIFGFSITLLVIATEVPSTYVELQASMYSFMGFIFCILLLLGIWNDHNTFFLHYGLDNRFVKILNSLFLFVLLFYVYPLKYLFSYLGTAIYLRLKLSFGDHSDALKMVVNDFNKSNLTSLQWEDIMIRFGIGLFLINFIFMLLHLFAERKKKELRLNKLELHITRTFIYKYAIVVLITLTSISIVVIFGGREAPISGFVYLLIPVGLVINKKIRQKKLNILLNKKSKKSKKLEIAHEEVETMIRENGTG